MKNILYVGSGNIAQALSRNALWLLLRGETSDYDGYFQRVYVVAFPAGQRQTLKLTDRHLVIDFDARGLRCLERIGLRAVNLVIRELAFLAWACRLIKSEKISVVVATEPYLRGLSALILSRLCGVPYGIQVTRDYDFDYRALGKLAVGRVFRWRAMEKAIERMVFRNADIVLADREHYRNYALASGARQARTFATKVIVDEAYYTDPAQRQDMKRELGLEGQKLLLFVGRLEPDKFPGDNIRCLAVVRHQRPDAHLLLAGDGPLRGELQELAQELGVAEGVRFLGPQPLDKLPSLMASADVIMGSHMGYTLIEGALAARPIVAYNYEWHPEVIKDGHTGLLVPFGDYQAMAQAVLRLLADEALAQGLGQAARAFALEHHRRAPVIKMYQSYYDQLFKGELGD